mmetsp:Transcript_71553/g.202997  ORF Transcript_71553/g.202997 Transcript_71553/m.202997 type:complete len:276 (-) Transcript_71553:49-876(-)
MPTATALAANSLAARAATGGAAAAGASATATASRAAAFLAASLAASRAGAGAGASACCKAPSCLPSTALSSAARPAAVAVATLGSAADRMSALPSQYPLRTDTAMRTRAPTKGPAELASSFGSCLWCATGFAGAGTVCLATFALGTRGMREPSFGRTRVAATRSEAGSGSKSGSQDDEDKVGKTAVPPFMSGSRPAPLASFASLLAATALSLAGRRGRRAERRRRKTKMDMPTEKPMVITRKSSWGCSIAKFNELVICRVACLVREAFALRWDGR